MKNALVGIVFNCLCYSVLALGSIDAPAKGETCPLLSDKDKARISSYIEKRFGTSTAVSIVREERVDDSCYRRLTLSSKAGDSPFQLTMFLSPDLVHFSRDLDDARQEPGERRIAEAEARAKSMSEGSYATWGSQDGQVSIVIFSDFECPFCKKAAEELRRDVMSSADPEIKVIFRNFPLPMHPWAQTAAESAACVRRQANAYFWIMHDFIFENQEQFGPDTARYRFDEKVKTLPGVDFVAYTSCMDSHSSSASIKQDFSIGESVGVEGTPAIYINGYHLNGSSQEQLLTLIRQMKRLAVARNSVQR